jgi:hypothetical protein
MSRASHTPRGAMVGILVLPGRADQTTPTSGAPEKGNVVSSGPSIVADWYGCFQEYAVARPQSRFRPEHRSPTRRGAQPSHQAKKSTTPVSKLYIAPAILMEPLVSIAARTELSLRMLAIVISTFFSATASTNV